MTCSLCQVAKSYVFSDLLPPTKMLPTGPLNLHILWKCLNSFGTGAASVVALEPVSCHWIPDWCLMSGQINSDSICFLKAHLWKTQTTEKICPVLSLLLLSWIIDTSRKRIKPGHSDTPLYLTKSLNTTLFFYKTTGLEGPRTKSKSFAVVQLACWREWARCSFADVALALLSLCLCHRCIERSREMQWNCPLVLEAIVYGEN